MPRRRISRWCCGATCLAAVALGFQRLTDAFAPLDDVTYMLWLGPESAEARFEGLAAAYGDGATEPDQVGAKMSSRLGVEIAPTEAARLMRIAAQSGMMSDATINVYAGASPWNLTASAPVLSLRGTDPCLCRADDGGLVLFYGGAWGPPRDAVFRATAHPGARVTSYPAAARLGGEWHMASEWEGDLLLWRAVDFPGLWQEVGSVASAPQGARHPTLLEAADGRALLFAANFADELEVFVAPPGGARQLPWPPHPLSPVAQGAHRVAGAGGFFRDEDGRLYRPGQDVRIAYGLMARAWRVLDVSASAYAEDAAYASSRRLCGASGRGFDRFGGHVTSIVPAAGGGGFVGAFDGYGSELKAGDLIAMYPSFIPANTLGIARVLYAVRKLLMLVP